MEMGCPISLPSLETISSETARTAREDSKITIQIAPQSKTNIVIPLIINDLRNRFRILYRFFVFSAQTKI